MIRKAKMADAGALAAFLEARIETSMFLLGNLEAHGTDNTDHPHGTAFFLRETGDGITGVFGATNAGFVLCQLPDLTPTEAQTYAHLLRGYTFRGMNGAAEQVRVVLDALSLPAEGWQLNRDEPLYALDLNALAVPDQTGIVRPAGPEDRDTLELWFDAYMTETGTHQEPGRAAQRAEAAIGSDRLRVLEEAGQLTAMTGLNSRAGAAVQVGGVYVPPDLRGKGRAGRVVAGHLAQLRETGLRRAILFAHAPDAARAYERIGFQRTGTYRLAMRSAPVVLGAAT